MNTITRAAAPPNSEPPDIPPEPVAPNVISRAHFAAAGRRRLAARLRPVLAQLAAAADDAGRLPPWREIGRQVCQEAHAHNILQVTPLSMRAIPALWLITRLMAEYPDLPFTEHYFREAVEYWLDKGQFEPPAPKTSYQERPHARPIQPA